MKYVKYSIPSDVLNKCSQIGIAVKHTKSSGIVMQLTRVQKKFIIIISKTFPSTVASH
jgi:hypothetical protein